MILIGAFIPIVLVLGLSLKNWVLFGTPSTSSWAGMNLMQIDDSGFRGQEETDLQHRGIISPISAIGAFQALSAYKTLVPPDRRYAGVPVLAEQTKPTSGSPNFNNIEYVSISNRYLHDFLQILGNEPSVYFRGVWRGLQTAVYPSSEYAFFVTNRSKIEPYVRGYNAVVLWQPRVRWENGAPTGTALGNHRLLSRCAALRGEQMLRAASLRRVGTHRVYLAFAGVRHACDDGRRGRGESADSFRRRPPRRNSRRSAR